MLKHIKKFNTHAEYVTFIQDANFVKPNVSSCVDNREVHYNPWTWADEYLTFVALEDTTFTLSRNAVSYSLDDGETWAELAAATASPTVTAGNSIMWKATLTPGPNYPNLGIGTFSSTGQFDVKGNIMSLLYGDNFKGQTDLTGKKSTFTYLFFNNTNVVNAKDLSLPATILASNCYFSMFSNCTSLTTAPELPATILAEKCYYCMFYCCTSLTTAPELPATTMASYCYQNMFQGCTGLTTATELSATTLATYCYQYMYQDCTGLTTAPELPATTLEDYCYSHMFQGCTGLTTAPELPATTLTISCYESMFNGCSSLTTAPELPATTLANKCYYFMFEGCTSLTTAPELPATALEGNCYSGMFRGCTNLNYIKAMFTTTPGSSYTDSWVSGVAASGTFVKNSTASWDVTGADGIPSGWTIETASE